MGVPGCPSCSRPVQLGKTTCLYCGAPVSGAVGAVPPPPSPAPGSLKTAEDLAAAIKNAIALAGQGRAADAQASMGAVLLQLSFHDVRELFNMALKEWLESIKPRFDDAKRAEFDSHIKASLFLVSFENWSGAFTHALKALVPVGLRTDQHHLLPLLAIGLKGAAARSPLDPAAPYTKLVMAASEAILVPERMAEGFALLEQALALLPNPPVTEADRARRETIERALRLGKKTGARPPPAPKPAAGGASQILSPEPFDASKENWGFGKASGS